MHCLRIIWARCIAYLAILHNRGTHNILWHNGIIVNNAATSYFYLILISYPCFQKGGAWHADADPSAQNPDAFESWQITSAAAHHQRMHHRNTLRVRACSSLASRFAYPCSIPCSLSVWQHIRPLSEGLPFSQIAHEDWAP
jgi:hypothetical protein